MNAKVLKDAFELLGFPVRERVTGFKGTVTHVGVDLYGCVQAIVSPGVDPIKNEVVSGTWFDVKRLEKTGDAAVMPQPDFTAVLGGFDKPSK